jgi:hypothetical protein
MTDNPPAEHVAPRDHSLGSEDVRLAFDGFKRWQDRRAALQLLNFVTIALALVAFTEIDYFCIGLPSPFVSVPPSGQTASGGRPC